MHHQGRTLHRSATSLPAMRWPLDSQPWRIVRNWPEQADTAYVEALYRRLREGRFESAPRQNAAVTTRPLQPNTNDS